MSRNATLRLSFAVAAFVSFWPSLVSAQLGVFVDDDNHFVMEADGFEVLGIQLESSSGSLVPADIADTGPFDVSLMKNSMIVMFGSLGQSVNVDGEVKLPTQWNPDGQKDVGFHWGSPSDQGSGSVVGHTAEFVTKPSGPVAPPESTDNSEADVTEAEASESDDVTIGLNPESVSSVPLQGGAVASQLAADIAVDSAQDLAKANDLEITTAGGGTSSLLVAPPLPGYVGLDLLSDPLLVYVAWDPEFESLTVASESGLLTPAEPIPGVNVISQSESLATFAFDDLRDGTFSLPLRWLGDGTNDVSLSVSPANESILLEVLGEEAAGVALPEPNGMTLALVLAVLLPLLRQNRRA